MIQLRNDCLIFKTTTGQAVPCSAELVTAELIGDAAKVLDPELIQNAAAAVLHYFQHEVGRTEVSVGEFSLALERVLRSFGLTVRAEPEELQDPRVSEADLKQLAVDTGKVELLFFSRLREELRQHLRASPSVVRFRGLRGCVKQLSGARRWNRQCQRLNDQIIEFLRHSLFLEPGAECALVVS